MHCICLHGSRSVLPLSSSQGCQRKVIVYKDDPPLPCRRGTQANAQKHQEFHEAASHLDIYPARTDSTPAATCPGQDSAHKMIASSHALAESPIQYCEVDKQMLFIRHREAALCSGRSTLCRLVPKDGQLGQLLVLTGDQPYCGVRRNGTDIPRKCASAEHQRNGR